MQAAERRVLIRTQPLGHNYGGLLQAYALQTVIRQLGHQVATDDSQVPTLAGRIGRPYLAVKPRLIRRPLLMREVHNLIDTELLRFVETRLETVKLYFASARADRRVIDRFDTFVAGSDQVWRPKYSDVPSALFDFLDPQFSGLRISYAASFGTDHPEFDSELTARTRALATRFDAISVRETSGISLVEDLWGRRDALCHPDPTMLLEADDYLSLIESAPQTTALGGGGKIVSYLLDPDPDTQSALDSVAHRSGSELTRLLPPPPQRISEYLAGPELYRRPAVETWLAAIRDARLVVTDSFHGCVFAILFKTPFVVIPNQHRGTARFDTLLGSTGLDRQRSTAAGLQAAAADLLADHGNLIDWAAAHDTLRRRRAEGLTYLRDALG